MCAKLYKQFQDFHETIRLDKESSQLKEKRETLQSDIEAKLPDKLEKLGIEITKSDLHFFDQGSYRQNVSTGIVCAAPDRDVAVDFELDIKIHKQRCTRGYKRYKETSGLIEWKECQIFHSIFT